MTDFLRRTDPNVDAYAGTHASFAGSPVSRGLLQPDMWQYDTCSETNPDILWDWATLRERIQAHGVRNSLLLAPMPTASTSQIMGNTECIEPATSNMYTRGTSSGEHWQYSRYLQDVLLSRGLWNDEVRRDLLRCKGSVQGIRTVSIPKDIREVYRTVWELKQLDLARMNLERAVYVCQNTSFNVHIRQPTLAQLNSLYFYQWKHGAKSAVYYLRESPKAVQDQTTITDNPLATLEQTQHNYDTHNKRFEVQDQADVCTPECDSCQG